MSKPPGKRKAFDANLDENLDANLDRSQVTSGTAIGASRLASLDLLNPKTSPKSIATALLSLLPDGATKQHSAAKKLVKAFPLVVNELYARSHALVRENELEGTRLPLSFRFPALDKYGDGRCNGEGGTVVTIPEESFLGIMRFLEGREIVKISLVNKAWLSATRLPSMWERLDRSSGLVNRCGKRLNMQSFLKLLARPQFANLKSLTMPCKVKLGKNGVKQMARVCPQLEAFDLGFSGHITGAKPKDEDIINIAETFPNLTSIRIDMWNISNSGIVSVAEVMESRLLDLRIEGATVIKNYLTDSCLGNVTRSCPNLKHFTYKLSSYNYKPDLDQLTGNAVVALVRGCPRLETLELEGASKVGKDAFSTIVNMVTRDEAGYALRKIDLKQYPFVVRGFPFRIEDVEAENG
mmetsp:Transcript_14828/g.25309  ORF Transcript_14828/g.25309 Transcript_14828/m.25309 type:complete len:410 (-) Transcript_14828:207-1436(-)